MCQTEKIKNMKRRIYILIISALVISGGLTSCLKDKKIDDQEYGLIDLNANKIIEIPSDASHEVSLTLLPEGLKDITIGEVRLAAEKAASEDIVVSLTTGKSAEIIGDEGPLFPLSGVTVPASVTIPKGERSVPLIVKVNTALLESEPQYLAISISSVDKQGYIISGNFGLVKLNMKIKHKYQGRYICTGTMTDVTNAAFAHASIMLAEDGEDYLIDLETVNGSTLIIGASPTFGGSNRYLFWAGSGYSYYGSFCPQFTFDDAGNVTAVTNAYGQPAANTRSAALDPAGINKYDPATKTINVSYYLVQPSSVPTPPNYRCHMVEKYTFLEDL